jgi:hypothetical protein
MGPVQKNQPSSTAATPLASDEALGTVFDHRQAMARSDCVDRVEIRRLAVEAHMDDGPCARCDRRFHQAGIQLLGGWVDVHIHLQCAQPCNFF